MSQLPLTNVVVVSVSQAPVGAGQYNTSNTAIFTAEPFTSVDLTNDGFKIYLEPTEVATDFGTASDTYAMALSIFSQQPNILAGGGYLVIIPLVVAVQHLALSGVPASGSFNLAFTQGTTATINWNDSAATIQGKIRAQPGLESVVVTGSLASESVTLTFDGVYGPEGLPTVGGSGLQTSAPASITITPTTVTPGETLATAITRTAGLVQYFAILPGVIVTQTDMLAAAAVVQALNKIIVFASSDTDDVEPGGRLDLLESSKFDQSRGLFYGTDTDTNLLVFSAAYVGRAFSTDFSGSNTTQNMHMKDLLGISADPIMTQTLLNKCQAAGADTYPSLQGIAKVFCSGANRFFDQVYNQQWFTGALQIAIFNALAETSTKVPQTEQGVAVLSGAGRSICQQAVNNQYVAPGTWNNPTTFGNQADFYRNIIERGFYVYTGPVATQSQADRSARKAPLMQIALKEAGAIDSASIIVYINP